MYTFSATVVIPVYNKEQYVAACLDSLLCQTCGMHDLEIVCVDDGSTDTSHAIVDSYRQKHPNIVLIHQENAGVSAARNRAMRAARGRYIIFLDADDMLSPNTVADLVAFFDAHHEETDIVTYPIYFKTLETIKKNPRTNSIQNNTIISIEQYPEFSQTTLNVCVKNDTNIVYFNTKYRICEDQLFNTAYILRKKTIGVCVTAQYIYRRDVQGCSKLNHAYYSFDDLISHNKEMQFLINNDSVNKKYIDMMLLYDLAWKIKLDCIFPYHYTGEKFKNAYEHFINIINKVENKTIIKSTKIIKEHIAYLLSIKQENKPFSIIEDGKWWICDREGELLTGTSITLALRREKIFKNTLHIIGFLKSVLFNFTECPILWMRMNETERRVDLYESANSMFNTKIKTNCFWGFELEETIHPGDTITFRMELEGKSFPVDLYFCGWNNLNSDSKKFTHYAPPLALEYSKGILHCRAYAEVEQQHQKILAAQYKHNRSKYLSRQLANFLKKNEIWLYYDYCDVYDNGYLQFRHDLKKKDGIFRFYVYMGDKQELHRRLTLWERLHTVCFGSRTHKQLFLACSKILTSYSGISQTVPYTHREFAEYSDLTNFETIYLQHGVMHARCEDLYAKDKVPFVDKIIASTHFEIRHFKESLHFRDEDILPVGMPRFAHLHRTATPQRRAILFAPSWRKYLAAQTQGRWVAVPGFAASDFYRNCMAFLEHPELVELLVKYDLHLDIKIHPNFHMYKGMFAVDSERLHLKEHVDPGDYCCLITDFSSYLFDFLYLHIPVIHYMPDEGQFLSGMHSYREFIHPLENTGPVTNNIHDLLSVLSQALDAESKGQAPSPPWPFLQHSDDICEDVYRSIRRGEASHER